MRCSQCHLTQAQAQINANHTDTTWWKPLNQHTFIQSNSLRLIENCDPSMNKTDNHITPPSRGVKQKKERSENRQQNCCMRVNGNGNWLSVFNRYSLCLICFHYHDTCAVFVNWEKRLKQHDNLCGDTTWLWNKISSEKEVFKALLKSIWMKGFTAVQCSAVYEILCLECYQLP